MDPVTITAIATSIATLAGSKAVEAVGKEVGEAGWGLANKILDKAKSLLGRNDDEAKAELEAVEASADPSEEQLASLQEVLEAHLTPAKKPTAELLELLETAAKDPVLADVLGKDAEKVQKAYQINQNIYGDSNKVIGNVEGDVTL